MHTSISVDRETAQEIRRLKKLYGKGFTMSGFMSDMVKEYEKKKQKEQQEEIHG